jgi:hypothetical protein
MRYTYSFSLAKYIFDIIWQVKFFEGQNVVCEVDPSRIACGSRKPHECPVSRTRVYIDQDGLFVRPEFNVNYLHNGAWHYSWKFDVNIVLYHCALYRLFIEKSFRLRSEVFSTRRWPFVIAVAVVVL